LAASCQGLMYDVTVGIGTWRSGCVGNLRNPRLSVVVGVNEGRGFR